MCRADASRLLVCVLAVCRCGMGAAAEQSVSVRAAAAHRTGGFAARAVRHGPLSSRDSPSPPWLLFLQAGVAHISSGGVFNCEDCSFTNNVAVRGACGCSATLSFPHAQPLLVALAVCRVSLRCGRCGGTVCEYARSRGASRRRRVRRCADTCAVYASAVLMLFACLSVCLPRVAVVWALRRNRL